MRTHTQTLELLCRLFFISLSLWSLQRHLCNSHPRWGWEKLQHCTMFLHNKIAESKTIYMNAKARQLLSFILLLWFCLISAVHLLHWLTRTHSFYPCNVARIMGKGSYPRLQGRAFKNISWKAFVRISSPVKEGQDQFTSLGSQKNQCNVLHRGTRKTLKMTSLTPQIKHSWRYKGFKRYRTSTS